MKTLFLSRPAREKVLIVAFMLVGAVIWLSDAAGRLGEHRRSAASAASLLKEQQLWLDQRVPIEAAAAAAVGNLDAERTYNATFLVAEVMALARRAGLSVNTDPPRTQRTNQFAFHTVTISTQRADLASLVRFYISLAERMPYLGLEQIVLAENRSAPGMLNARLEVASVELLRGERP